MAKKTPLTDIFGLNVFSEKVMKGRLPKEVYKSLKQTIQSGTPLKQEIADVVSNSMKDWALERGATHYTHWFQPLTGITAEKHDSFISPTDDGGMIMEFSGKQLVKGEPDASSFPSGGIRATFEARGYTAWDCTSPAFLKEDASGDVTLCIPTAFYSYTGEALDKKIPVLRSMDAVSQQALRVLRRLGNTTSRKVISTVGPEQEYFLIDKNLFLQRVDLMLCGRTLFGAPAPKGQELEDQYFGAITDRVAEFMKDLDVELWKMGISAKTKHNEVAPAQFELAPIFNDTNIATDHNQLVMETMKKVALRHNLVCLLFEKPYAGINGSGKHNNWALGTDNGINLLDPGHTPHDNAQFLVFVSAVIKAVDTHADLLRASTANPGNDHRLGANEAPPAIISIFMGQMLTDILTKIATDEKITYPRNEFLTVGVDTLPALPKDNSDRNRTSPFAFTGNKFEFRMVGSSQSIADPNTVLNAIVAEALDEIATRLEKATDVNKEVTAIVKEVMQKHGRIIFNGNNYSEEWVQEAAQRGLPNIRSAVEALKSYITPKAEKLFETYGVMTKRELHSRYDISIEQYSKHINIEALCACNMTRRQYLPAVINFSTALASSISAVKAAGGNTRAQEELLVRISNLLESASAKVTALDKAIVEAKALTEVEDQSKAYRDKVMPAINNLRKDIDELEIFMPREAWPVPTYQDLLFRL